MRTTNPIPDELLADLCNTCVLEGVRFERLQQAIEALDQHNRPTGRFVIRSYDLENNVQRLTAEYTETVERKVRLIKACYGLV